MERSFKSFEARLERAGLKNRITKIAVMRHVTLQELYEAPATTSVVAARKAVYAWLQSNGKSVREIGRLFDRAQNGVLKLLRTVEVAKKVRR